MPGGKIAFYTGMLDVTKNTKNGVMNIFTYHIEQKQEELVVYFLIIKMMILKMILNL